MRDFSELTLKEIAEIVRDNKLRYELTIEPNGYGGNIIKVEVEPWEKFEPNCPYGIPVAYVREKKENGTDC